MKYIEIEIAPITLDISELLIAELSENGFAGFEQGDDYLKAYISKSDFREPELDFILNKYSVIYTQTLIQETNWNELWESNFDPVVVDDFVGIRAYFHDPIPNVDLELLITPKMSFGTGHHATTYLMMQFMKNIDFKGKSVFDFGTGTGILAILAEKLGGASIIAGDHDDWCIDNASENILNNQCKNIDVIKLDSANNAGIFQVVIANINKNIIIQNLQFLDQDSDFGADILLSGLLLEDEPDILLAVESFAWSHIETKHKKGWIALHFKKN